jgi:hypothetical protein
MKTNAGWIAAAVLLGGCATAQTVVEADPVIAGKTYVDRPVSLGRVKMMVDLQPQVVETDDEAGAAPGEQLDLTLGFLATGEAASVVARSGTLRSKKDGAAGELVARFQAGGTALGCVPTSGADLTVDYWFNGTATGQWKCVTLRFRVPGRLPTDPLELTFEPINVGGELVRALPVTFAFRTLEIQAD